MRVDQIVPLLQMCAKRMVASQLPSCVRSFCLPIAYAIYTERQQPLELIKAIGNTENLLWHWIEYTPKFSDEASIMSYMGLAAVLRMTNKNIEFAGIRVKKGGEYSSSNETILL